MKTDEAKVQVWVIENDIALADAYSYIIAQGGYDVSVFASHQEAMKHLAITEVPDVLLLDVYAPDMSGLAFLESASPKLVASDTAIIVLSNSEDPAVIDYTYELGATAYMIKAWVSPNDLLRTIDGAAKNHTERRVG